MLFLVHTCVLRMDWHLRVEQWQDWDLQSWKYLSCDPWLKRFAEHGHRPQLFKGQGKQSRRTERKTEHEVPDPQSSYILLVKKEVLRSKCEVGVCIGVGTERQYMSMWRPRANLRCLATTSSFYMGGRNLNSDLPAWLVATSPTELSSHSSSNPRLILLVLLDFMQ